MLLATFFLLGACEDQSNATREHSAQSPTKADGTSVSGEDRSEDLTVRLGMAYDHAEAILLDREAENISSFIGYRVASSVDGIPTFVATEYFKTKGGVVYCLWLDTKPETPIITKIQRADSAAKLVNKAETWIDMDPIEL